MVDTPLRSGAGDGSGGSSSSSSSGREPGSTRTGSSSGSSSSSSSSSSASDDTPGRIATAVGVAGQAVADTPVGRSVGGGFDGAFGDRMGDRGALGGVDDRLESAEDRFQRDVVDPIQRAPVEDEGERFGRDVTAQTASFANPAGIARDALTATEGVGRGVQRVTAGPESVQSAGETTADVARATPELARRGADAVRENPRDAAVTGTAVVATGGLGALGVRGARGARSAVNDFDGPDLSSFATDRRATTTGRQRGDGDGGGDSFVSGDDLDVAVGSPEPNQGRAAYPDPIDRFEGGAGFGRGSPDRGDVGSNPAAVDPSGSGDGLGFRSVSRELETAQIPPQTGSPTGTAAFGPEAAAGGLGVLSATNDPSGISPRDFGGVDPAADPAATPAGAGGDTPLGDLAAVNDPTATGTPGGRGDLIGPAGGTPLGELDVTNDPSGATTSPQDTATGSGGSSTGGGSPTGTATGFEVAATTGTQPAQRTSGSPAQTSSPISDPTTGTIGRTTTARGGRPGGRRGDRNIRRTPGFPDFGQSDAEEELFGVESDDDTFGTGILSGDEAASRIGAGTLTTDGQQNGDPFGFGR